MSGTRRLRVPTRPAAALAVALVLVGAPGHAQSEIGEEPDRRILVERDAVFVGGALLSALALAPLDAEIARRFHESPAQDQPWVRGVAGGVRFLGWPGSGMIAAGMFAGGRAASRPELAEIGLLTGEAIVLAEIVTVAGKWAAGRARPRVDRDRPHDFAFGRGVRSDDYQALPSGHTSAAFAAASLLSGEVRERWPERRELAGVLLHTTAGLVAISRIYHDEHWASDVVAGAAVGALSGRVVGRFHRGRPHHPLHRVLLASSASPAGSGVLLVVPVASPRLPSPPPGPGRTRGR